MYKREFRASDYPAVDRRGWDDYLAYHESAEQLGSILEKASYRAITLCDDDDQPFACAGTAMVHPGVVEVWMLASEALKRYTRSATRLLMIEMKLVLGEVNARRVQAHVHEGHEPSQRWLKWCGFLQECKKPLYYADGSAAWVYVMYPFTPREQWADLYKE